MGTDEGNSLDFTNKSMLSCSNSGVLRTDETKPGAANRIIKYFKPLLFSLAILLLLFFTGTKELAATGVVFEENFTGATFPPNRWQVNKILPDGTNWEKGSGDFARHTFPGSGEKSHSWLITPLISLDAGVGYVLEFDERLFQSFGGFPIGISNVKVSNSGFSPSDFNSDPENLIYTATVQTGSTTWRRMTFSLEFADPTNIYIAFEYFINGVSDPSDYHDWEINFIKISKKQNLTIVDNIFDESGGTLQGGYIWQRSVGAALNEAEKGDGITKNYPYNQSVELIASPRSGFTFDHWEVNGTPYLQPQLTIALNQHTIARAIFTPIQYEMLFRQHTDGGDGKYNFSSHESIPFNWDNRSIGETRLFHSNPTINRYKEAADNFSNTAISSIQGMAFYFVATGSWIVNPTETFRVQFYPSSIDPASSEWPVFQTYQNVVANIYFTGYSINDEPVYRAVVNLETPVNNLQSGWVSFYLNRFISTGNEIRILKATKDLSDNLSYRRNRHTGTPGGVYKTPLEYSFSLMLELWGEKQRTVASWTGANGTDWFDAGNWSTPQAPTTDNDYNVNISTSDTGHWPAVSNTATAYAHNITIGGSASLTISGGGELVVHGNFTLFGSVHSAPTGTITFTGPGKQLSGSATTLNFGLMEFANLANTSIFLTDLNVSGGILTSGAGRFKFEDGRTVRLSSASTVTANSSSSFHNVDLQGNATFHGTGAMVVKGALTLNNHQLTLENGSYLQIDPNGSIVTDLTSHYNARINGKVRHWVGSTGIINIPVGFGIYNRWVRLNYSDAPSTSGYIDVEFEDISDNFGVFENGFNFFGNLSIKDAFDNLDINTLSDEGVWSIAPSSQNGVSGGTYTVEFNIHGLGLEKVEYPDKLRMTKTSSTAPAFWTTPGTPTTPVEINGGTDNALWIGRTGVTGYSRWAIGSNFDLNPLPIELYSFTASPHDDAVLVEWVTAAEINNSHFVLERAFGDGVFVPIARISGAGNSNTLLSYSYTDHPQRTGVIYYRLTQHDFDGKNETFAPVAVRLYETTAQGTLSLYPNPTEGLLNIVAQSPENTRSVIELYNLSGRLVHQEPMELFHGHNHHVINLSNLPKGIYMLRITSSAVTFQVERVVVK